MLISKLTIPQLIITVHCNIDRLKILKNRINKQLEKKKIITDLNDFIIKAAANTFLAHPDVNVIWLEDKIRK